MHNFEAAGVDGFVPLIALTDADQNLLANNAATSDTPFTTIPGFTPLEDQNYFLFVMENNINNTGSYGLDVTLQPDEDDGTELTHGSILAGTIGPIGDVDEYVFTAEAGQPYSLLATPRWHNLDPQIRVLNSNGQVVLENDDSTDGLFSILSKFILPAGEYRVQVMASDSAENDVTKTGVYAIQFAEGATFDRGGPRVAEHLIDVEHEAGTSTIHIPTNAVFDDTFPLTAAIRLDKASEIVQAAVSQTTPTEVNITASENEIFFLQLIDTAESKNQSTPVVVPPPAVFTGLSGQIISIAVDRENNVFATDSELGGIVKLNIDGATEAIHTGEETGGGTLGPNSVAFGHEDILHFSNARTNQIKRILPDGSVEIFAQGEEFDFPIDLAFDAEGILHVAQLGKDNVLKIFPDGTIEPFVTDIRNPQTLAFSPGGTLFVGNSVGEISRIAPDGSSSLFAELMGGNLEAIAFDRDGFLYAADGQAGFLHRFSPQGERSTFTRGLSGPVDIAFGQGEMNRILFVTNVGLTGNFYAGTMIGVPTGRPGVPLPFGSTKIINWRLMD